MASISPIANLPAQSGQPAASKLRSLRVAVTDDTPFNPTDQLTALRIVDVNLNRASEGLRVVEEYCRFVLADAPLTARCKSLRDELHAAVDPISRAERLMARDTTNDVGATLSFDETFGREVSIFSLEQIA